MDPNATYKELTNLMVNLTIEENDGHDLDKQLQAFMELFDSLDRWLQNGGFLPDAWRK